jgi:transglutaminase-like putative cysteine protease
MSDPAEGSTQDYEWTDPLLLSVRHLTRYDYHDDVWDSFNEARLQPVNDTAQECQEFHLRVEPTATSLRDYPDFYGNCVHYFDVPQKHARLEVEATSRVATRADTRGPIPAVNPPSALQGHAEVEDYFDFLNDSHFVSLDKEVWRESIDALPNGVSDLWQDALTVGRHIYKSFTYTPFTTTVNTRPAEVVLSRRGVCQDFAHVMLGMCRSHGIPARYISGYFFNPYRLPDEIEASHAWVEVYLPGYGWKGFDPTHNRVPDTRYVKLAVGRDYGDIKPVSGTFRGKGTRELRVEVQIRRVEAAE